MQKQGDQQPNKKQGKEAKAGNQHFRNNVKQFYCLSRYYT